MKCLGENENGDIFIENGKLKIFENIEALAQVAMNVVYTLKGEVILNQNRGIPYFEVLFNNKPNAALLKYYITQLVSRIDGVKNITEITATMDKNLLKYSLTLDTIYGKVVAHD